MTSGRDTLHRLDSSIAEMRHTLARAGDDAASDAKLLAVTEQSEVQALERLADIRMEMLRDGDAAPTLGAVDDKARSLISAHESRVTVVRTQRDRAEARLKELERERRILEEGLAAAVTTHDEAAAATRERLEQDPEYERRATGLEEANAIVQRVNQKLEVARADRAEKGAPYEADPLFSYLHKRRFGTSDYRAFPLFSLLDRWVAGLIRYRNARLNYDRLLELPERIADHATRTAETADRLADEIEAFERAALEADGVGVLRDKVARARKALDDHDETIAKAETAYESLATQFSAMAAGKTGPLKEARDLLTETLGRLKIPELRVLSAETATKEDDRIVDDLIRLKRERMELEEARRSVDRRLERQGRTLTELESIRRSFKQARFDSPYSEFPGNNILAALIEEFMRGALTRDELWRRIERNHRTRRRSWDDSFGGDEWRDVFGPPRSRDWSPGSGFPGPGFPAPRRPGGTFRPPRTPRPPRMPRSPRGGGFKTGGGF